jgi:hypothetical protein
MFSTDKIIHKNPLTSWQKLDNQILIISEDNQYAHELNEVAAYVWERLDSRTINEMVIELAQEYEMDNSTLLADVQKLLIDLQGKKLLL